MDNFLEYNFSPKLAILNDLLLKVVSFKNLNFMVAKRCSAFFLIIFISLSAQVIHAKKVGSIKVEGISRFDKTTIINALGIKLDSELSIDEVRKGIRRLYALNLFSDIRLETIEEFGELTIIIKVIEKFRINKIILSGNNKIKEADLKEKLQIIEGQILSEDLLQNSINDMKSLYFEKGYLNIRIEKEFVEISSSEINVHLLINEGEKVRITKIYISGNQAFLDEELKSKLKTKEHNWYRGGEFKNDEFEEDLKKIETFYRNQGFLDIQVTGHKKYYKNKSKEMVIDISLDEGNQYRAGKLTWEGNNILGNADFGKLVKLKQGDLFNQSKFDRTMSDIYSYYSDRGYIYLNLEPEKKFEECTVNVNFVLKEGNPAKINKINIKGNTKTREKVIRRELLIYPTDVFNRSYLIRSQQNIFNLGFFEDIQIDPHKANESGDLDLNLLVKEKFSGQFNAAVAYSALDKFTGILGISHPNLFGKGQLINFNIEFGKIKRNIQVGFTEPWFLDTPTALGFEVYNLKRDRVDYDEKRKGGLIKTSRPLPGVILTKVSGSIRVEDVDIQYDEKNSSLLYLYYEPGEKTTISTAFTIARDSRDNYFFSTSGSKSLITAELAGGVLAGDVNFQKYSAETTWYFRTLWKFALSFHLEGGIVEGYNSPKQVPLYERFEMGGTWGIPLRGYSDRSIGISRENIIVGGRSMFKASLEYKFPIVENQIFALLFFDAGNTWENVTDINPSGLKKGAGIGVRLQIPGMGMMGFDFGYGFDREDGGGWEPHFQLGTPQF